MTHVAACRQIFGDIAKDLRFQIVRRKVVTELKSRCVDRWRRHAGSLLRPHPLCHSGWHAHDHHRRCLVHSVSQVRRDVEKSPSAGGRRLVRAMLRTLHWPIGTRATAARVVQARSTAFKLEHSIQGCLEDLAKVDAALKCKHGTHNSFHSLTTAAYTCVHCGVRIDSSSKSFLVVQALDNAMFEYPLAVLRPKLVHHLHRLGMALEDVRSFSRLHSVEVETKAALLIQRATVLVLGRKQIAARDSRVLDSMKAWDRRKRQRQCARELLQLQCRVRRKPIKMLQVVHAAISLARCHDAHDDLDMPAKLRTPRSWRGSAVQSSTPEDAAPEANTSSTPPKSRPVLASPTPSSNRTEDALYVVLPLVKMPPPSPEVYRCFAPQCGGRKFHNKKWFSMHVEKHATAKKRLQDEAAFLDRMRHQGLPTLHQHAAIPPPAPQPTPKIRLPSLGNQKSPSMVMQLVRLDTVCAADVQVVRLGREMPGHGLVVGRSAKHCDVVLDCPAYPELVSKQHLRLIVVDTTVVMVEDLGSKNGTFVNGTQQSTRTELRVGDTIELGRVKHRRESGVVFVCHLPNRTTSTL